MAEPISIQQLKDASEDAISLADFINEPENVMIPRRLASDINSLQYYLEYMKSFSQRSYETYDEMVANASNLSENVSVFVTNDLDTTKNGIYTYNGTSFVRGEYQPENLAKEFVEGKLSDTVLTATKESIKQISTTTTNHIYQKDENVGHFKFDSSNLSGEVAGDTGELSYIPPSSDTTGASGAWVRVDGKIISETFPTSAPENTALRLTTNGQEYIRRAGVWEKVDKNTVDSVSQHVTSKSAHGLRDRAVAIGDGAYANEFVGAPNGIAIGRDSLSMGTSDLAVGYGASSLGGGGVSIGNNAKTTGTRSVAIGANTNATSGIAIGREIDTVAEGTSKTGLIAIGKVITATSATGVNITMVGTSVTATGDCISSIFIGDSSSGTDSKHTIVMGRAATAKNFERSVVLGTLAKASSDVAKLGGIAIGNYSEVSETGATALGDSAKSNHSNSAAIGSGAVTRQQNEVVLGGTTGTVRVPSSLTVSGAIQRIQPHPDPLKTATHLLCQGSFTGEKAGGSLYTRTVTTIENTGTAELPTYFKHLNSLNVNVLVSAKGHFGNAYATVSGNTITVTSDTDGDYEVLVVGQTKSGNAGFRGEEVLNNEYFR